MYGFGTTPHGAPTDGFGRLVYLDPLDAPSYGRGWRRENSFVPHHPMGALRYGFYAFNPTVGGYQYPAGQTAIRGPGIGTRHRISAEGPGVTTEVSWERGRTRKLRLRIGRPPARVEPDDGHPLARRQAGLVGHS